jgi:hypothetical protein
MDRGLFGQDVPSNAKHCTRANGYADVPGKGPAGETCKTCRHMVRLESARVYFKCRLCRASWTYGVGTDIRSGSPACRLWEPKTTSEKDR